MASKIMESYLLEHHKEDITDLLNDDNDKTHMSIVVDLAILKEKQPILYKSVITQVQKVSLDWNNALLEVQKKIVEDGNAFLESDFQIKENCHVRFVNLPITDNPLLNQSFPSIDNVGSFAQVKGTITRVSQERLLEFKREYVCNKCKESFLIEAEYGRMYIFDVPKYCINSNGICRGTLKQKNPMPLPNCFMDFQEIRLQEMFSKKRQRLSLMVCLENDLADTCVPGECVTICGTIEYQRRPLIQNRYGEVIITMHAVGIIKDKKKVNINKDFAEKMICVRGQWEDDCNTVGQINARDLIIQSICPEVYGMYPVKLALALALCSGMKDEQSSGVIGSITKRGNSHILLIGDPGLAKSVLLKSIAEISIRSVHTTGLGCSTAGLTAAAVRDQGEWHLEAGALVLADGGVCCIDEFNLMQEHDKGALHEAMEQQTVSIAKAGIVSILNTRCVILAATNARCLYTMSDPEGLSALNIGIATPLLSRFDLIFILRDDRSSDWDNRLAIHLLNKKMNNEKINKKLWNLERLQSHFLAVHEIKPILTTEAHLILSNYYKMCRSDSYGDPSRTTVRLLDSLIRLAQSHARLMLRSEVLGIDAIIVVLLMESTLGFGRLLTPLNIVKHELPLGPNSDDISRVLNVLGLTNLEEKMLFQLKSLEENIPNNSIWEIRTDNLNNENEVGKQRKCDNNQINFEGVEKQCKNNKFNINDIERIFGFENQVKKVKMTNKENKNILNDSNSNKSEDIFCLNSENSSENSSKKTIADNQPNKSLASNNTYPPLKNDLFDWGDDNDFELSLDLVEKMENSQKFTNPVVSERLLNKVIKDTENIPFTVNSIYDDPNLDDLDLELDSLPSKKQSKSRAEGCSKDIQNDKTKTKRKNNTSEKCDKKKKSAFPKCSTENSKKSDNSITSVPGCSKNISITPEKRMKISPKTLQKLNNFVNPLQIDKNDECESLLPGQKETNNAVSETVNININSQNSIFSLATQYENLDFLEFD